MLKNIALFILNDVLFHIKCHFICYAMCDCIKISDIFKNIFLTKTLCIVLDNTHSFYESSPGKLSVVSTKRPNKDDDKQLRQNIRRFSGRPDKNTSRLRPSIQARIYQVPIRNQI